MTATMVGADWGMAALGIHATPRKQRETVVRAEGLTKRYGEHAAVSNISSVVRRDYVFGFLGPSDSGKSTTIGIMLDLVQPSSGSIDLFGLGPERRAEGLARVGAIIETSGFGPYISGRNNLNGIEQVSDQVAIIHRGTVCAAGAVSEIVGTHTRLIVQTDAPQQALSVDRETDGVERAKHLGHELTIFTTSVRAPTINAALVSAN